MLQIYVTLWGSWFVCVRVSVYLILLSHFLPFKIHLTNISPILIKMVDFNNLAWATSLSPFLTGRMFVRPNILRTLRRTMIRFLIGHLVRRIWFGQSRLYFILNWLVMRCKLRPELAADAQQTA